MNKLNINLLPKEVLEKRKAEQRLVFMLLGVVVMVLLLVGIYGFNLIRIVQEQAGLDAIKAENNSVQMQIAKIADFVKNKALVEEREKLVNTAIVGKYSWSRFLNNISLLVPNEVWLTNVSVQKGGVVSFSGSALSGSLASGIGHKPVAKWLVHLVEVADLEDIWLSSSRKTVEKPTSGSGIGPSQPTTTTVETSSTVNFETKAVIKSLKALEVSDPNAPAPPAPGGKT